MQKILVIFLIFSALGFSLVEGHPFTKETIPAQSSNVAAGITRIQVNYSEAVEI